VGEGGGFPVLQIPMARRGQSCFNRPRRFSLP
jgi:hypothetical protein